MGESSKASSGQGQPPQSPLQRLARDPEALRQTHAATHRFVDWLEAEVQDAVDAARSRRLAPIKHVAKVCGYLQRRYLPAAQVEEAGRRSPRKPSGLVVEPAFVHGLTCLDPTELAARVAKLQEAILVVQPYDGEPFERKPIFIGSPREKAAMRKKWREKARLEAKEDPERIGLAAVEAASTGLMNLFRDVAAQLAERIGGATPRRKAAEDKTPTMLSPPMLAKRLGVSSDKVRDWIRSGQLAATDVSQKPGGRPRFKISEEAIREFEKKRQPEKPLPAPRRRRKKDPGVTEYFK